MRFAMSAALALTVCATGCSIKLSTAGKTVVVADKAAVDDCSFLGTVTGKAAWFDKGAEPSENDARNKAADKGATHLRVIRQEGKGKNARTEAEAFKCFGKKPKKPKKPSH